MPRHIHIIPDKLFHKLWNATEKYSSVGSYIDAFTRSTSENYIDFRNKYNLEHDMATLFLKEIYEKANYRLKDIMEKTGLKKADISHMFCIPIRTIEDWYSNKNKTPAYIKLMLLRNFYLFDFDKIYIESEYNRIITRPYIYQRKLKNINNEINEISKKSEYKDKPSAIEDIYLKETDPYEYYSKHTHEQYLGGIYASLSTREFLDSLSYLDGVMKDKN